MELLTRHASGAEEWFCPICARRFVIQWPPKYQKIILEIGDEYAAHTCNREEQTAVSPADETVYLSEALRDALDEFFQELSLS